MNTFDPFTLTDLALQSAGAVVLVILCELAKRQINRTVSRRRIAR
ncbi:hypothetical protein [Phyllobacterium pellucidum]|nr:hypothetical protein [Phyllobacterium pellucidum]